jgi:hypothetical protein
VEYSEKDLDVLEADLIQAERRRDWMSGVAATLKSKNRPAQAAERQQAYFAAMAERMKEMRARIEQDVMAQRGRSAAD